MAGDWVGEGMTAGFSADHVVYELGLGAGYRSYSLRIRFWKGCRGC